MNDAPEVNETKKCNTTNKCDEESIRMNRWNVITWMKTWMLTEIECKDEYNEVQWMFGWYIVLYVLIKAHQLTT